jgi:hypothetical protein
MRGMEFVEVVNCATNFDIMSKILGIGQIGCLKK